jgi:hypothetical protein
MSPLPDTPPVAEKARTEYVKYQVRTLSDVEKQYLASIKDAEAAVKKRKRK